MGETFNAQGAIAAESPASMIPVYNPATGEPIAEVADGGAGAVDAAVGRARETFGAGAWRRILPNERAEIVRGGWRLRPGYFVEPTVVTNVNAGLRLFREEILVPVVGVVRFDDEEAAIADANNSEPSMPFGGHKQSGWSYEYA